MVTTRKRGLVLVSAAASKVVAAEAMTTPLKKTKASAVAGTPAVVQELLEKAGIAGTGTVTKSGWCLKVGMNHVLEVDRNGKLLSIVQEKGLPAVYGIVEDATCRHRTDNEGSTKLTESKPQNCFQSLCRIVAGQQLAGAAARAMWYRLLKVVEENTEDAALTPNAILALASKSLETHLQKPAGLSRAKARSIVSLAEAFQDGTLTEDFLTSPVWSEEEIRAKLLPIRGVGPWTCDMFLMFFLEKGNVLPVGDLGVRKGIAKYFGLKGKGYKGSLCPIKDKDVMERVMAPYQPYQSIVTYYMWAVADTKDFYRDASNVKKGDELRITAASSATSAKATPKESAVVTP